MDPGFPQSFGGSVAVIQKRGTPTYYLTNSCQKMHENKENRTEMGRHVSKILLCRSTTDENQSVTKAEQTLFELLVFVLTKSYKIVKQECIPVECVPSASMVISEGEGAWLSVSGLGVSASGSKGLHPFHQADPPG